MPYEHLGAAVMAAVIFGAIGIGLILVGYKLFDWITPKINVQEELSQKQNIAVAIVVAAVIIGISLVVAASIAG